MQIKLIDHICRNGGCNISRKIEALFMTDRQLFKSIRKNSLFMVGIWWKNNVKHLLRVRMHLTAFMFWEICIFIPVMNTQLHGTSNYKVLIYYKPNAYPLFHETSLALSCCISQHEGVLLGKIWEFEMSFVLWIVLGDCWTVLQLALNLHSS